MRGSWLSIIAACWATATFASAQAPSPSPPPSPPKAPIPLEAFGQLPSLEDVQISPKGDLLAYVTTSGDERTLVITRLADMKPIEAHRVGRAKLRWLSWADETKLLITTSTTERVRDLEGPKREWYQVICLDLLTKKQRLLMGDAENAMNTIYGEPTVRIIGGTTYAFVEAPYFAGLQGTVGLFRINLTSGASELIEPGTEDTVDWFVDNAGAPAAQARYIQRSGSWSLLVRKSSGSWKISQTIHAPIDEPTITGYGKDGKSVLVTTLEQGRPTFHAVSLEDGSWGAGEPDPYDHLMFDPVSHHLLGGVDLEGDKALVTLFDPQLAASWRGVEKAYSGSRVRLVSWTDDRRKFVVVVDGQHDGYGYALVDMDKKSAVWIGDIYDQLTPDLIAQPQPLTYKAADGLEIPAYLTLPLGRAPKNLPLIVMPHGGPADRDTLDFDWLREAFASRGYAVLQPNFRGSSGYPDGFLEAGYGQWGRKMQTDLSDGVRRLATEGVIDPKRVCIFGWSYGGYAALAGAALDPGVYRCAADMAGPADLSLMLTNVDRDDQEARRYWKRFMGASGASDPILAKISPAAHAADIDIPVLIVHGKDDTVVDFHQSEVMAAALKAAGKPFTFVTLDGEDHWGSRSETRLKLLQAVMDFMAKHNPADPPS